MSFFLAELELEHAGAAAEGLLESRRRRPGPPRGLAVAVNDGGDFALGPEFPTRAGATDLRAPSPSEFRVAMCHAKTPFRLV